MKLNKKGFTLIELMVVIAIIAILATVVLVSLSSARTAAEDANRTAALAQVRSLAEVYYAQDLDYRAISEPKDELEELIRVYGDADDYPAETDADSKGALRVSWNEAVETIDGTEYGINELYCASMDLMSGKFLCVDKDLAIKSYDDDTLFSDGHPCKTSGGDDVYLCP